jgi:hypothetical protein
MIENQITIEFTAPDGRHLSQTIPIVWCGKNVFAETLSEIKAEGATDITIRSCEAQ